MLKRFSILGILATILYLFHVILGGVLWKGYSHVNQPISDLTASGAPNRGMLLVITVAYGICLLIFAAAVLFYLRKLGYKLINIAGVFFVLLALTTLSYNFFPEDLPGKALTFNGFMHLVITGLTIPTAICTPLLMGIGFRNIKEFRLFSMYSIVTGILIFVSGGLSVVFIVNKLPYFGVIQRINIGSLELWVLIFAGMLFNDAVKFAG